MRWSGSRSVGRCSPARALAERLGDEVLVRERDDRDAHAGQAPELGGEHAAGVDDDLAPRSAPHSVSHAAHAAVARRRSPVTRVCVKIRAPPAPRALGQRVGQLRRVEVAVGRQVGRAAHAVGRPSAGSARAPPRPRAARAAARTSAPTPTWRCELLLALGRAGQPQRRRTPTQPQSERAVELDRVHHHPRQRDRARAAGRRGPAEWNVEPLVSSSRSTQRRRRARRAGRGGRRSTSPPTPPPMTTTRARAGSSRGAHRAASPRSAGRPPSPPGGAKCSVRVGGEVEVEVGDAPCTTPHIASRTSDMSRISRSAATRRGVRGSPK